MPTKVEADATYDVMGLNENYQAPGGINKNIVVSDEQESKETFTDTIVTDANNYADIGLNDDAIF